ncbi:hypothetical protein BKA62DRAFT_657878 [Auriculariales sp. MPI-PUGE-AT-0066]|nr:hypothetical protein BKA62DRAFT_657878 [Auriculariales sp. MPI-PUGE-AT-0066]
MGNDAPATIPTRPALRASRKRNVAVLALAAAGTYLLLRPQLLWQRAATPSAASALHEAADDWHDDVWPFRQPTPWDISTDFPHPRKLSYKVSESTWSNLDVHPVSGEIVLDILGDLYCFAPGSSQAHPILRGVPQDTEPTFSPSGDLLAFRSDAVLGIDNIWVMPWSGCTSMSLSPPVPSSEFAEAMTLAEADEGQLARGVKETRAATERRLLREGRAQAYRVTNETFRFVSHPEWHPDGNSVVATKWYTGSRSLGAGEPWQYDVPSSSAKRSHIKPGSGKRLVGRTLPPGWSVENYNEQQIGAEQTIWAGKDAIIYAKNVIDTAGTFQYSKDVHAGIYALFHKNLTSSRTTQLVGSYPGSASRPTLSRDEKTLAFVRRVRDKEALVLLDIASGTQSQIWYGLTYDLTTIYAPMGTYPAFAFTPSDDAIVIWAAGKLWHVPLTVNNLGQKIGGAEPRSIPFTAQIEKRIADTLRPETDLVKIETAERQRLYAFSELDVNHDGDAVLLNAAGVTYLQRLSSPELVTVPVLHPGASYYSPIFVPHRNDLVIHARWHDTAFSTFELAHLPSSTPVELSGLPLGRYYGPTLCQCNGASRRIAFVRFGGSDQTGSIIATGGTGLYVGDVQIPEDFSAASGNIEIRNIQLVSADIVSGPLKLQFLDGAKRLLVQRDSEAFIIDLTSSGRDAFGGYAQTAIASARMSNEVVVSKTHVAFLEQNHVYIAPLAGLKDAVWAKPGRATHGVARLSLDGGHDIKFSGDGKRLFWLLGRYLHSIEVGKLGQCSKTIKADAETFGIDCTKDLLDVQEIDITFETKAATSESDGTFVIRNATLLTMATGELKSDIIRDGVLVARGGLIQAVGRESEVDIPEDATILDAEGGIVTPGFIDVHAHWNGHFTGPFPLPARDWQHIAFLAYGITTLHNPSFENSGGYIERALAESGRIIAPRILHTGRVIYGGDGNGYHHEVVDFDQAREALTRIKAEGGPASFSYKNYQLPTRSARQRLLLAAKNMSMMSVPEGGMNFHWDLTYIADGMATVEHNIPIPVLHEDVLIFFAKSGTGATPTHIVDYGGAWGQELLWQSRNVANDEKLRRFIPHEMLQALQETSYRPLDSYQLFNVSASVAQFVHKGGLANLGAHGQPPVGLMYHAEASFFAAGGLTPYEVLRAATRDGAKSIGIFNSVGSLSVGKFADFLVYKPGTSVIDEISDSTEIKYVARSGRIWEAETMDEFWPQKQKLAPMPPVNAD